MLLEPAQGPEFLWACHTKWLVARGGNEPEPSAYPPLFLALIRARGLSST